MPGYSYQSADDRFEDIELPGKERDFDLVLSNFERHLRENPNASTILQRRARRRWFDLLLLNDHLTHPRWKLPLAAESPQSTHLPGR